MKRLTPWVMMLRLLLILSSLCLQSCVHTADWQDVSSAVPPVTVANYLQDDASNDLPTLNDLLELEQTVKDDFYRYFNDPKFSGHSAIERVSSYLALLVDQYSYSENTYTAQQTVNNKGGNCLSFTLLTTALARLAGVDVSYDLLNSDPTFTLEDDVLISADHMRAVLKQRFTSVDQDSNIEKLTQRIVIDYFNTEGMSYIENVPQSYQLSLYYSNRAAELLVDGEQQRAFAYARKALSVDQQNASAFNTLAILYRRIGEVTKAESIYQAQITSGTRQRPLFYRNYLVLLESQQRLEEAASVRADYELIKEKHPFEWIWEGKKAYARGDYRIAESLYKKALRIAPELHGLHFLIAKSSLAQGDIDLAKMGLKQAMELADANQYASDLYQKKLKKITRFQQNSL